jgi:adenylosuccinate synthase
VVLDPEVFCREVDTLAAKGVDMGPSRLMISKKAHLIMPYHKIIDIAREASKSGKKIGTTGRGIGPCYEDKAARVGLRAADLADPRLFKSKVERALIEKNALFRHLYGVVPLDPDEVAAQVLLYGDRLKPYIGDVSAEIQGAMESGKTVLFEGAQGTHLDIDHGTYPYVTSSSTVSGNAAAGSGCPPTSLKNIVAVVKAYTTRVGSGPFPTELEDCCGEHMQSKGAEFGATTGRKRRCGWLDIALLRESVRLNGPTAIALTKLDVLGGLPELKICTAYRYEGKSLDYPPQEEGGLGRVEPVYETMPGWTEDVGGATRWDDLPDNARNYIARIETLLGVPVSIISVGPDRAQTILRDL